VATMIDRPLCRRLSFRTEDGHSFYVEMNMEQTEFIPIEEPETHVDIDALLEQHQAEEASTSPESSNVSQDDIDALLNSLE